MLERFTDEAQQVVLLAEDEAFRLGHSQVRPQHVLIGILSEPSGRVAQVLGSAGVELAAVRETWRETQPAAASEGASRAAVREEPGDDERTVPNVPFSPELETLFQQSHMQAVSFGRNEVAPEHLLLALLAEKQKGVSEMLERLGVDVDSMRAQVDEIAAERHPSTPSRPLDQLARNVTADARDRKLDPPMGRDREIEGVMEVLSRRRRNVPVLVAEPGINKITIVEGLAQRIVTGRVPGALHQKELYVLDREALTSTGEGELRNALQQAADDGDVVIFLDELHDVLPKGSAAPQEVSALLRKLLVGGELPLIGGTTPEDHQAFLADDPDLAGVLEEVAVEALDVSTTIETMKGIRDRYEAYHRLTITDQALFAAASLASQYVRNQFLPDSAIDLIDAAAARKRTRSIESDRHRLLEARIRAVRREKEDAIEAQKFVTARQLRDLEKSLLDERAKEEVEFKQLGIDLFDEVDEDVVVEVVAQRLDVPVERVRRSLAGARGTPPRRVRSRDAPESQYVMLVDRPVESQDDDVLGSRATAEGIASILSRTPTPFVLALDGGWGVGKSTLLHQVERALPDQMRKVRFNAWTAQGENALEGLIKSVLFELDRSLIRRSTRRLLKRRDVRLVARIATGVAGHFMGAGRLVDELWERMSAEQSGNELREQIQQILLDWVSQGGTEPLRTLVVLIDDLDRCTDDVVVSVCEAAKLYLDAPGLVFVVACDLSVLARGVASQARGGVSQGRVYLEKIVQVAYRVPTPDKDGVRRLIGAYAERSGTAELVDESISEILSEATGRNPRRIKRILNSFVLEYNLNPAWRGPPLSGAELMTAVLLQHLYQSFYEFLRNDEPAEDAIGDFLDYADVRGRAANPPPAGDAWWSTARRVFRKHGLSPPKRHPDDRAALLQGLDRFEQWLPDDFPVLTRDEGFLSLLRGIGDVETRRAVHAQLVSRPLGTEAPPEAVLDDWATAEETGPVE